MAFLELNPSQIIYRFSELVGAPFQNPEILWFGLPLIVTLIAIEFSLHANKDKDTGISHALPNAIVLLFIAIDMLRVSISETFFNWNLFASMIVLALAAAIFLIDYYMSFPSKKLFGISAHLPVNTLAYALFVTVYNKTGFDLSSVFGMLAFMALLLLMFFLVLRLESPLDYSDRPRHKDIWMDRPKRKKEIEIMPKGSAGVGGDSSGDIVDPFKGVKKMRKQ